MNKALVIIALAMILVMPAVLANDVGSGIGISVTTQQFAPRVWMCDSRSVMDDNTENGLNGLNLDERKHNYAFEGESIHWTVLVMDKNKIEDVQDVVGTIGQSQGAGNDVEVECHRLGCNASVNLSQCNARVDQWNVTSCNPDTMSFYDCRLTVETPNSMHGEYFITVEAKDLEGNTGTMAENEYWFLNPTIALAIDGSLSFEDVMPGTTAYSNTILVGNDAEAGSGVILDMFVSGTDFYDPTSSGAFCSVVNGTRTNKLALTEFRYFATNGAFSTQANVGADPQGYLAIPYSTDISGAKRVIRYTGTTSAGIDCHAPVLGVFRADATRGASPSSTVVEQDWNCGNALSPGSEMAVTFKLDMPEPCNGDFSEGQIFFWGEAI